MNPAKRLLLTLASWCSLAVEAQTEFYINNNGLIYPDSTVAQLKHIVDSLNLRYKTCDLSRTYHTVAQTTGHYFNVDGADASRALKDIADNVSWEVLKKKYPKGTVYENILLTCDEGVVDGKRLVTYNSLPLGNQNERSISTTATNAGKWVYSFSDKKTYGRESVDAFYLNEPFHSRPLTPKYSKLVQYADCMIDTTTSIFTPEASHNDRRNKKRKELELMQYVSRLAGDPPGYPKDENWTKYEESYAKWARRRDSIVNTVAGTLPFQKALAASLEEAKHGGSNDLFEAYVERYVSPAAALELKRGRIVMGMCSMDQSPRYHALNIARLAASAVKWDVFLRAHLDIMNDRFERRSDGNYAWDGRGTYLRELEVLDINVPDLLAGITLRVADASSGHYFGNIRRVGRSLAESHERELVSRSLLAMISDNELDDYNRGLLFYLFLHYSTNLGIERERNQNIAWLRDAVETMPNYMVTPAMKTIEKFIKVN